ncbi:MAG: PepSY-associated TM helix domain-containing protein [Rhodocyclales bacterium]|nr:PepSY-associated TM helix domain-containing protein [Rhodocyclales bacterium]
MSAVLEGVAGAEADRQVSARRAHRRSVLFLRWLRKIHLWVGLWGAALGLLFGATGILLNHRAILKIPIDKTVQTSAVLPVPGDASERFRSIDDMTAWLQAELKFEGMQVRGKAEPARTVTWADREVRQPARWVFNIDSPHRGVSAEYIVGNRYVKVDTRDATPIGTLTRLHMAVGVNAFWVLLSDTIAGGLIVLCLTGLLLWSRMHKLRLAAVGASLGALVGAVWFLWSTV